MDKKTLTKLFGTAALAGSLLASGCAEDYSYEDINACESGIYGSSDPADYTFSIVSEGITGDSGYHYLLCDPAGGMCRSFGDSGIVHSGVQFADLIGRDLTMQIHEQAGAFGLFLGEHVYTCSFKLDAEKLKDSHNTGSYITLRGGAADGFVCRQYLNGEDLGVDDNPPLEALALSVSGTSKNYGTIEIPDTMVAEYSSGYGDDTCASNSVGAFQWSLAIESANIEFAAGQVVKDTYLEYEFTTAYGYTESDRTYRAATGANPQYNEPVYSLNQAAMEIEQFDGAKLMVRVVSPSGETVYGSFTWEITAEKIAEFYKGAESGAGFTLSPSGTNQLKDVTVRFMPHAKMATAGHLE